jgi:hypothetical protein
MNLINLMHIETVCSFLFSIGKNGHATQIIMNMKSCFLVPDSLDIVHGFILSLEQNIYSDLSLYNISFLSLIPPEEDFMKPLSLHSKQIPKSIIGRRYPTLKHLLLIGINLDDNIENFISISQRELDLSYLWNCRFMTNDPIWSALRCSIDRIDSKHAGKVHGYQLAIRVNGHTTRIVYNTNIFFSIPNSSALVHGLILLLGQDLPNDLLLRGISFLVFLSLEADPSQSLFSGFERCLKSIRNRQYPKFGFLFLKNISLDDAEKMVSFIQQSDLEVHYL